MPLIASIAEVPLNCEIVEIVCAFEFLGRFSQKRDLINGDSPFALATEIVFSL
jgi:hypothetical protein